MMSLNSIIFLTQSILFIDDHSYLVEPGSLVIIDKQQIHKTSPSTNHYHDRILIEFHQASLQHLATLNDGIELHDFFKTYKGLVKLRAKRTHIY